MLLQSYDDDGLQVGRIVGTTVGAAGEGLELDTTVGITVDGL